MLAKIVIIIIFFIILYNLFAGLKYLLSGESNDDRVLKKLKWRVGLSVFLFVMIIIAFLTGIVQLHTL